jgi:hypothetical protein
VPTNALGVLIFATLFVPGFIHREARRTLRPVRSNETAFEQTVGIVTVSLVTNLVVGLVFASLRTISAVEGHTPDVQALFKDFDAYVFNGDPNRTAYVLAWLVGYVAACSLLAVLLAQTARVRPRSNREQVTRKQTLFHKISMAITGPITADSAWYRVLERYVDSDERVWVGCSLSDGSYVSGVLDYFSTDADETGDRDLLIRWPRYRTSAGEPGGASDIDWTVVSARTLVRLDISYVPDDWRPPEE